MDFHSVPQGRPYFAEDKRYICHPRTFRNNISSKSASDNQNLQYNDYTAIGGLPTTPPGPSAPGQRMKEGGGVAYEGLKAVAQALYNCSDMFLPLKAAVGVFLEVTKVVDVRWSTRSLCILYSSCISSP